MIMPSLKPLAGENPANWLTRLKLGDPPFWWSFGSLGD
jgi:hypothetical protein